MKPRKIVTTLSFYDFKSWIPRTAPRDDSVRGEKLQKIFVAYSGGVDSHVLLHLMRELTQNRSEIKLTAIHVNHGINPQAKKWEQHYRKVCKKLGITYLAKTIPAAGLKLVDHSPEEILRKLRYEIFAKILPKDGYLLTAHQADDQAETLLLQLFRGAGPKGLAAMPKTIPFAKGWLVRPLLEWSREEILDYARRNQLIWIEDESNTNLKFDRNLIRHQLLPLIKKRWPAIVTTLHRVARHCGEASQLLETLAEKDLQTVINIAPPSWRAAIGAVAISKMTINILSLKKLPLTQQKNVLRYWLGQLNLPLPSEVKLMEIIRNVLNARTDATPVVKWFGAEVRRFRNNLYAMSPLAPHDNKIVLPFAKRGIKLPGDLGMLKLKLVPKLKLDPKKITIRFRRGGETITLPRRGTHELKKLMQEWQVPSWLRDRVPLIYYGNKIIAVAGFFNDN